MRTTSLRLDTRLVSSLEGTDRPLVGAASCVVFPCRTAHLTESEREREREGERERERGRERERERGREGDRGRGGLPSMNRNHPGPLLA